MNFELIINYVLLIIIFFSIFILPKSGKITIIKVISSLFVILTIFLFGGKSGLEGLYLILIIILYAIIVFCTYAIMRIITKHKEKQKLNALDWINISIIIIILLTIGLLFIPI